MNPNSIWTPEIDNQAKEIGNLISQLQKHPENQKNLEILLMKERNNLKQVLSLCRLIELYQNQQQHLSIVLFSSIEIKNIFKLFYQKWVQTELSEIKTVLKTLKEKIFELYIKVNNKSAVLCLFECLEIFMEEGFFPECWPELLSLVKMVLQNVDLQISNKIFKILKKLTEKYSTTGKTEEMMKEHTIVVNEIHDILLHGVNMCLQTAISSKENTIIALKSVVILLRTFYDCIYQVIPPKIGENISNWVQVIKVILSKEMETKVIEIIPNKAKAQKTIFNLKGDCVRIILLINRKYKQDFDQYLNSFTEEIWNNCTGNSKIIGSKMLTFSIRYFRTFASSPKYTALFHQKMKEILVKLAVPNYSFCQSELDLFEFESDSFIENLFTRIPKGVKSEREEVQRFVACLGKFHGESLFPILIEMFQSLVDTPENVTEEFFFQRVAFMNIVISAGVQSSNIRHGVRTITCPVEFVTQTFEKLILSTLNLLFSNLSSPPPIKILFIFCQIIRFVNLFRYYLPIEKLIELFSIFIQKNIHLQFQGSPGVESFEKTLFVFGKNILDMCQFTVQDKSQIDQTGMTFYEKFYVNQKTITIHRPQPIKPLIQENNPFLKIVCDSMYQCFTFENYELKEQSLMLFNRCLKLLGDQLANLLDPLLKIYSSFISKILQKKIPLNFGLLNQIFQSLGSLIRVSSSSPETAAKIVPIITEACQLFTLNESGLHSLIIQVFTVFIHTFKINVSANLQGPEPVLPVNQMATQIFGQSSLFQVITFVLSVDNYQGEFMVLSDFYLLLLARCSFYCPGLVVSQWNKIANIFQMLIKNGLHKSVFKFLRNMMTKKIMFPQMFEFLQGYISHILTISPSPENLIELQIFFREMGFMLMTFIEMNGAAALLSAFSNPKGINSLRQFLAHNFFSQLVSQLGGTLKRQYFLMILTKFLFENVKEAMNVLTPQIFKILVNALVCNVYLRKNDRRSLKTGRVEDRLYNNQIERKSGGIFKNFYNFRDLKQPYYTHVLLFRSQIGGLNTATDQFVIQNLKTFLQNPEVNAQQLLKQEYLTLLNN